MSGCGIPGGWAQDHDLLLGYAMSLFGRPGDLLTHVLVSDPYEHVRNFYYPTPQPKKLEHRHTKEDYDSAKAKVTLVDIPSCVCARKCLPISFRTTMATRRQWIISTAR